MVGIPQLTVWFRHGGERAVLRAEAEALDDEGRRVRVAGRVGPRVHVGVEVRRVAFDAARAARVAEVRRSREAGSLVLARVRAFHVAGARAVGPDLVVLGAGAEAARRAVVREDVDDLRARGAFQREHAALGDVAADVRGLAPGAERVVEEDLERVVAQARVALRGRLARARVERDDRRRRERAQHREREDHHLQSLEVEVHAQAVAHEGPPLDDEAAALQAPRLVRAEVLADRVGPALAGALPARAVELARLDRRGVGQELVRARAAVGHVAPPLHARRLVVAVGLVHAARRHTKMINMTVAPTDFCLTPRYDAAPAVTTRDHTCGSRTKSESHPHAQMAAQALACLGSRQHTDRDVVVVGGSFGGLQCALELAKAFRVTVLDNKDVFEFTPSMHTALGSPARDAASLFVGLDDALIAGVRFVVGVATGADGTAVRATLRGGEAATFPYDYLVVATGCAYPGPTKAPPDRCILRDERLGAVEAARDKGDSTSLQREFSACARSGKKHPRFETVPRDDRSSKNQPKRVENGRDKSL